MRNHVIASLLAVAFAAGMIMAEDNPLAALPWIGDGLPDRNGADWYAEDPAPEFRATFTMPEGTCKVKVHFACAGFASLRVGNETLMNAD